MCGDEREKDKDSGRGEKEVWGEIDRMYKLVIHSEHKIIGTKKKSRLPLAYILPYYFPLYIPGYSPELYSLQHGGPWEVALPPALCDSSVYEFIHLYMCMSLCNDKYKVYLLIFSCFYCVY